VTRVSNLFRRGIEGIKWEIGRCVIANIFLIPFITFFDVVCERKGAGGQSSSQPPTAVTYSAYSSSAVRIDACRIV